MFGGLLLGGDVLIDLLVEDYGYLEVFEFVL